MDTTSFHVLNILIHAVSGILIFLVIRRLLEWAGVEASSRTPFAVFGALLFLLHPLQAESVAYISGRSDALCGLFGSASFAAFLYRRSPAISWRARGLGGAAVRSRRAHQGTGRGAARPFCLTDLWWNPESRVRSVRANWKLYATWRWAPPAALRSSGG